MELGYILEQAGIPLLLFVICMYYGIRLWVTKDASLIRPKGQELPKNEAAYAQAGGILLIYYALATLVMAILLFVNLYAAVAEIIVCTILLGVFWKRMDSKYRA